MKNDETYIGQSYRGQYKIEEGLAGKICQYCASFQKEAYHKGTILTVSEVTEIVNKSIADVLEIKVVIEEENNMANFVLSFKE